MPTERAAVCHIDSQYEALIRLTKYVNTVCFFYVGEFVVQYMAHNGISSYVNRFCTSEYCVRSTFGTLIVLLFVCWYGLLHILVPLQLQFGSTECITYVCMYVCMYVYTPTAIVLLLLPAVTLPQFVTSHHITSHHITYNSTNCMNDKHKVTAVLPNP